MKISSSKTYSIPSKHEKSATLQPFSPLFITKKPNQLQRSVQLQAQVSSQKGKKWKQLILNGDQFQAKGTRVNFLSNKTYIKRLNGRLAQRKKSLVVKIQQEDLLKMQGKGVKASLSEDHAHIFTLFLKFNKSCSLKKTQESNDQNRMLNLKPKDNDQCLTPVKMRFDCQLKKYNRVYNYTLQRHIAKNSALLIAQNQHQEELNNFLNVIKQAPTLQDDDHQVQKYHRHKNYYEDITNRISERLFMTRKPKKIHEGLCSPRINDFIVKQGSIRFEKCNQKPLSKKNAEKLKVKMNDIAHDMYKIDSKYRNKSALTFRSASAASSTRSKCQ